MHWLPHVTLGKKLSGREMRIAFEIMQNEFAPFEGKVVSMGLAKPNPHKDILTMKLPDANITSSDDGMSII